MNLCTNLSVLRRDFSTCFSVANDNNMVYIFIYGLIFFDLVKYLLFYNYNVENNLKYLNL